MKLNVPANFSFRSTVNSHGWYLLAPFRWSPREKVLRRAEVVGGKAVDLTMSFSDGRTSPSAPRGVEPRVPRGGADEDVRPSDLGHTVGASGSTMLLTTSSHRAHKPPSSLTSSRYCQQRPHFIPRAGVISMPTLPRPRMSVSGPW